MTMIIVKFFSRQIEGIGNKGDLLFAISTSGKSRNIIEAALTARSKQIKVIGLTGAKNSKLEKCSDICIKAPSEITSHIQELHITIIHLLCILIELEILEKNKLNNFTNFFSDLDKGELKIWDLLAQGVVNKKSKFHTPTLSTVNGNMINSRTIILRKVDNKTKMLFFYSDSRSRKF